MRTFYFRKFPLILFYQIGLKLASGWASWIRTNGLVINSHPLYLLSYSPMYMEGFHLLRFRRIHTAILVAGGGLEPPTSRFLFFSTKVVISYFLSYNYLSSYKLNCNYYLKVDKYDYERF